MPLPRRETCSDDPTDVPGARAGRRGPAASAAAAAPGPPEPGAARGAGAGAEVPAFAGAAGSNIRQRGAGVLPRLQPGVAGPPPRPEAPGEGERTGREAAARAAG